ncbi:MAG TPA: glycosyltransferase family 39 protein, partial [Thermoanaerobaculia bacterium]|nr:glycosyltransferase family 39 protein [Thermoanaerobaculia bacterium]
WDEPESYGAGVANLRWLAAALAGRPLPPWPWHELPGYQFAADTVRAAVAGLADRLLWDPGSYLGFHLANLLFAALAVALVARLAAREAGPIVAPLAATSLLLQPKLIAHAQANPKDVVALLAWCVAVLAVARAARRGGLLDYAVLGVGAGAAVASHVTAVLLAPLALLWVLGAGTGPPRRRALGLLVAGIVASMVTLLLWPWLWPDPWTRAAYLLHKLRTFDVPMQVLYLGRLWRPRELPWHYGMLSLAIATPLPLLLAAGGGLLAAFRRGPATRLCRLAALWLGLLLLADLRAPARYDGARHLLPALPALALLAAGGIADVATRLRAWRVRSPQRLAPRAVSRLFGAVAIGVPLLLAVQLAAIHPYADAFLNAAARAWLGPEAQRRVELESWGGTYKEGAAWLLAHTPPDALVLVPIGPQAAAPFLAGRRELRPHDGDFDRRRPQYLMLMAREAWYTPRARRIVEGERPLFSIRRQGSTLLAIYRVPPLPTSR